MAREPESNTYERDDFHRTLVDLSPDAIIIHVEGRIEFVNEAGLRMFGLDNLQEVLGRSVLDFIHPDNHAMVIARIQQMRESGGRVPLVEERYLRADGSEFTGEVAAAAFTYEERPATLAIIRDVSDRKQLEEAARERERAFRNLFDANVVGMSLVESDGIKDANDYFLRVIGRSRAEVETGQLRWQDITPAEYAESDFQYLQSLLVTGAAGPIQKEYLRPDGSRVPVLVGPVLIDPDVPRWVTLTVDLSPQKAAERRLRFLATASEVLGSSLDFATTLRSVARLAVPTVADWCVVDLVDEKHGFERLAMAHADPEMERRAQELRRRFPDEDMRGSETVRRRESSLVSEITDEMILTSVANTEYAQELLSFGLTSSMVVPIMARGEPVGAVTFLSTDLRRRFGEDDLVLAEGLAARAGMALDNSRLFLLAEQAREHAETQRARLYDLFMQAPAVITVTHGPDHHVEFINDYGRLGRTEEPLGKPLREAFPELISRVQIHDEVYRTGQPFSAAEMPIEADWDGSGIPRTRYSTFVVQPTREADGSIDGTMMHLIDVTEQVLARRGIEQLAAEREAILAQMADGVCITDPGGNVTYFNNAARSMLGDVEICMHISEYIEPLDGQTADGGQRRPQDLPLARALRGETVIDADWQLRTVGHAGRIMQGSAAGVRTSEGELVGAVLTFRDVTEERDVKQQQEDFLVAAAHDLKTPLTTISGLAQLLVRRAARLEPETAAMFTDRLTIMAETASRMSALIEDLIDATRLQSRDLYLTDGDLVVLVRAAVAEVRHAGQHEFVLENDVPDLIGRWDAGLLSRAIGNLLSNAIRYSPEGGTVHIRLRSEGGQGVLSIHDQGIGIPAADLPHIFERFYRAGNVEGRITGTGIGLVSVRRIVERHGGDIQVESEEGQGSTFTLRLPLNR